jgi:hypothetical protein
MVAQLVGHLVGLDNDRGAGHAADVWLAPVDAGPAADAMSHRDGLI